jgi:hypothetical protein
MALSGRQEPAHAVGPGTGGAPWRRRPAGERHRFRARARRPARVKQLIIERDEQTDADHLTLILTRVAPQEKAEIRGVVEQLPFILALVDDEI